MLPALSALRRAVGPRGAVELLGRFPHSSVACGPRHAALVHDFDRGLFRGFYERGAPSDEEGLRRFLAPFDLVVAWARLPRITELASSAVLTFAPLPPDGVHASDHALACLERAGIEAPSARAPELELDDEARAAADAFIRASPLDSERGFVAIHPSSGSADKNWHPMYFRDIAILVKMTGRDVLWIEGEADGAVVTPLQEAVSGVVARRLRLATLAALLGRSSLYVGNDSGVTHLAAASGASTVAIFVRTDPRCWAPRGKVVVLGDPLSAEVVWGIARERFALH